jgi:hypothetical protein
LALHRGKCFTVFGHWPGNPLVNKKILMDVIGVLLIALVVVIGYKLSPMLLPKADVTVQPDPACDLQQQTCAVDLPGGGKIALSMGTRPVPMVKPFAVQVSTQGFVPGRVEVDFTGIDMNMGFNRPELTLREAGTYVAEATLPVCITGQMDWQVTLLLETGSQRIAIPFRLRSGGHD